MIPAIIELATQALLLWNTKLSRKYLSELNEIENKLREAKNVEYLLRNHRLIDDLNFKLQQCLRNIAADLGKPDIIPSP